MTVSSIAKEKSKAAKDFMSLAALLMADYMDDPEICQAKSGDALTTELAPYFFHSDSLLRHMKSMLVIDSPTLAKLFAEVFGRLGWTVAICNNRECAMSRVAGSEPYDLILLSHHLSGIDVVQLSRFIRSLEHRMTTAVVMLASSGEITDEAKAAGVDEVLIKPVNVSTLIWAINKHVS